MGRFIFGLLFSDFGTAVFFIKRNYSTFFKKTLAFSEDILYNIRSNYFALYKNTLTGIK